MGRDIYSEGKLSPMVLPNRPCPEDMRSIVDQDARGAGASDGKDGSSRGCIRGGRIVSDDVLFYVGKRRQAYTVSAESLTRGSVYFRNLLQRNSDSQLSSRAGSRIAPAQLPPIIMDCEESVFENMLLLIRYGTWKALPPMSDAESYRLKKEVEFYGLQYIEPLPPPPPRLPASRTPSAVTLARTNSSDFSVVSTSSPASSPSGSPKSDTETVQPAPSRRLSGRFHEGVRVVGRTSRQLAELPDFPVGLSDPAKFLLVTCLDEEKAPIYACSYCSPRSGGDNTRDAPTQWALSFHHRHAFCTSCGRTPANMAPKQFAEMFTAAAAQYHSTPIEQAPIKPQAAWWVGSDSTCLLRFVSSASSGPDACRSARCGASPEADTVWAATFFYAHAFCTRCGQPAPGAALLSLLLALRYGGASPKKSPRQVPAPPADG